MRGRATSAVDARDAMIVAAETLELKEAPSDAIDALAHFDRAWHRLGEGTCVDQDAGPVIS